MLTQVQLTTALYRGQISRITKLMLNPIRVFQWMVVGYSISLMRRTVRRTVSVNRNMSQLVFWSALHTLVSIRKFDNLRFSVTFKGGKASFANIIGWTFMTGEKYNHMYLLDLWGAQNKVQAQNPIASIAFIPVLSNHTMYLKVLVANSLDQLVSLNIWHQHFGHAGLQSSEN